MSDKMKSTKCPLCGEAIEKDYTVDAVVDGHNLEICIFCGMILEMTIDELSQHLHDKAFHDHYGRIALARIELREANGNKKTK